MENADLAILGIGVAIILMIIRNNRVLQYRMKLLEEDFEAYKRLPDYYTMVFKFWVWPLSKFRSH